MKTAFLFSLLLMSPLPLAAQGEMGAQPVSQRVYVGMVADEQAGSGLLVRAVAPASPAHKAGICAGDILLQAGDIPMNRRSDLRQLVARGVRGQVLPVELLRGGQRLTLHVTLELRPDSTARNTQLHTAFAGDRHIQPIKLPDAIRQEIKRHRRVLREQLASLPDGLVPSVVTSELQAIRDLARDVHSTRPGWMSGRAGEITLRFRDEEGSVILYGANNQVSLELYNLEGRLLGRYELNTQAERRALSESVLQRLQRLR